MAPANVKDPSLYDRIKNTIKRRLDSEGRRWGAYASGELVKKYKLAYEKKNGKGSPYTGSKNSKTGIARWFGEKWIDVCKLPKKVPCGRSNAKDLSYTEFKKKFPYCRPSVKVTSSTPKLASQLTPSQKSRLCALKKKNPSKIARA